MRYHHQGCQGDIGNPGGIDDPMLAVELPASFFIEMIRRTISPPMQDMQNAVSDLQGTIVFEPVLKDGELPLSVKTVMNQTADPSTTLTADFDRSGRR
ncbi:MAG: hypothetical protein SWK76_13270 [Actinomycetota bacterium]|nr:hypothetical protein [Actinomycetota bacterium]